MNIDDAYKFCEKVANKDKQGLLGPDTFNAFIAAAQTDAILVRLPLYSSDQGVMDDLLPVVNSLKEPVPLDGIIPRAKFPRYFRALSLTRAASNYDPKATIDLLAVDQFRIRSVSDSTPPSLDFPIAVMNKAGLNILPKNAGNVIFDYVEEPATPFWNYTLVNGEPVYRPSKSPDLLGRVSVDLTLPSTTHLEICARVLVYAGLHLSDNDLYTWGLTRASITSPRNA